MLTRVPSPNQTAIFNWVETGTGNAIIEAVAGSGKSYTLEQCVKLFSRGASYIILAFNRDIAHELASRKLNARTFHSMCMRPALNARGQRDVEPNKLRILIEDNLGDKDVEMYGAFIRKLVAMGKNMGFGCLTRATPEAWADLVEHHDMELDNERASMERALELADKLLKASNESDLVDWDDVLYIPVLDGLSLPKFDWVLGDEQQDTNAIQRALLRKILKPSGRFIGVGDSSQAIYGFRGADSDSLDLLAQEFNCTRLPLSVTYRCPKLVVERAQEFVPHIQAAPDASDGVVESMGQRWDHKGFQAQELVVCRTTAPLVALAYRMMKDRKPVMIRGKEVGEGLINLIKKLNAKGVDALVTKLAAYTAREAEKATAKGQDDKATNLQDKADAIMCIVESLPETNRTVPALVEALEEMFRVKANCTELSTIHKSKGLEAHTVYWMIPAKCRQPRQEWQQRQEANLCYVAITRAKARLYIINEQTKEAA